MNISPINQNEPACRGYVHKSVTKYLDYAIQNEHNAADKFSEIAGNTERYGDVFNLIYTKDKALAKISSFLQKCHPKTCLKLEKRYGYDLVIKNDVLDSSVRIGNEECIELAKNYKLKEPLNPFKVRFMDLGSLRKNADKIDIDLFSRFVNIITENVTPENIDDKLLEKQCELIEQSASKTGIFGKISTMMKNRAADKFILLS